MYCSKLAKCGEGAIGSPHTRLSIRTFRTHHDLLKLRHDDLARAVGVRKVYHVLRVLLRDRLAERFTRVVGLDFSGGLVARAKLRLASTTNVEVFQADLTQRRRINEALSESVVGFEPIAFAVCTNVLLAPSTKARMSILRNLFATVAEDGTVLLVVPSRESALFVNHVLRRWQGDDVARREGLSGRKDDVLVGLLNRGETLTKHYLREEIILDCEDVGFEVKSSAKVEYKWSTEFEFATKKVPKKVKGCALPWDWLLVLRRT